MHTDYLKRTPQWKRVRDAVDGQDAIHAAGDLYLPKTSGMVKNDADGAQYNAYRARARFYELTQDAENGILGLATSKAPEIDIPIDSDNVTIDGKSVNELAKGQLRESLETGRGVMVVDAPEGGGDPYITEYECESLVDWATDDRDKSKLVAAKFKEVYYKDSDTYKEDPEDRYREYLILKGNAVVRILNDQSVQISEDIVLPLDYLPIFFSGSVDTSPEIDPIPLLPIANASIAIYQLSADYRHGLFMTKQATPWVKGIDEDQWKKLLDQGIGSSALWWLGDESGETGFLETSGNGTQDIRDAMGDERKNAEGYAVAMTEKGGIESAEALRIRSASQHATIYTVMDSVSAAIVQAITCMAEWSGVKGDVVYKLNTDFTEIAASETMLNSINATINAGNLPQEIIFEYVRSVGLTSRTDDELRADISDGGGATLI